MTEVRYSERYRVPFGETDAAGVVFYPNFYRWFDRMTHELFRTVGQPLSGFMDGGHAPVLAETGCRFVASARYDDLLSLTALVADVRTRSLRVDHEVRRGDDLVAEGFEIRIWVEMKEGAIRSVPIPPAIVQALRPSGLQAAIS